MINIRIMTQIWLVWRMWHYLCGISKTNESNTNESWNNHIVNAPSNLIHKMLETKRYDILIIVMCAFSVHEAVCFAFKFTAPIWWSVFEFPLTAKTNNGIFSGARYSSNQRVWRQYAPTFSVDMRVFSKIAEPNDRQLDSSANVRRVRATLYD